MTTISCFENCVENHYQIPLEPNYIGWKGMCVDSLSLIMFVETFSSRVGGLFNLNLVPCDPPFALNLGGGILFH